MRCAMVMLMSLVERSKYHTAWFLSHISLVISKIDYVGRSPETHKDGWGATRNLEIKKVEFPQNPKEFLDGWNIGASEWLKNCIYLRLIFNTKLSHVTANIFTSIVSSIWHGFLPGYYICFSSAALLTLCAKISRKYVRPLFLPPSSLADVKYLYDIAGRIATSFLVSYLSLIFVLGASLEDIFSYLVSVKFCGHILCIIPIIIFILGWLVRASKSPSENIPPKAHK